MSEPPRPRDISFVEGKAIKAGVNLNTNPSTARPPAPQGSGGTSGGPTTPPPRTGPRSRKK